MPIFKRKTTKGAIKPLLDSYAPLSPQSPQQGYQNAYYPANQYFDDKKSNFNPDSLPILGSDIRTVYRIPIRFENHTLQFHFKVWVNACGITEKFIKDKMDFTQHFISIGFYDKTDADAFMVWWNKYEALFSSKTEISTLHFPRVIEGECTGYFCQTEFPKAVYEDVSASQKGIVKEPTLMERLSMDNPSQENWLWIVQNTSGAKWLSGHGWLFKNQTDYTLFKMIQK